MPCHISWYHVTCFSFHSLNPLASTFSSFPHLASPSRSPLLPAICTVLSSSILYSHGWPAQQRSAHLPWIPQTPLPVLSSLVQSPTTSPISCWSILIHGFQSSFSDPTWGIFVCGLKLSRHLENLGGVKNFNWANSKDHIDFIRWLMSWKASCLADRKVLWGANKVKDFCKWKQVSYTSKKAGWLCKVTFHGMWQGSIRKVTLLELIRGLLADWFKIPFPRCFTGSVKL